MNIKSDTIYYLSPFGLGDTLGICSYFKAIKARHGAIDVCLLAKDTHEFVAKMCGVSNYASIGASSRDGMNQFIASHAGYISSCPAPGRIYIAHPFYNDRGLGNELAAGRIDFNSFYMRYFGSAQRIPFKKIDLSAFRPSPTIREQAERLAGCRLEDAALCITETRSITEFHQADYTARFISYVQNASRPGGVVADRDMKLSLEELISIAAVSRKVYANKSGLCDILAGLEDRLTVVFPNDTLFSVYSAKKMFDDCRINEIFMSQVV